VVASLQDQRIKAGKQKSNGSNRSGGRLHKRLDIVVGSRRNADVGAYDCLAARLRHIRIVAIRSHSLATIHFG